VQHGQLTGTEKSSKDVSCVVVSMLHCIRTQKEWSVQRITRPGMQQAA
jgi:hypothetical protein